MDKDSKRIQQVYCKYLFTKALRPAVSKKLKHSLLRQLYRQNQGMLVVVEENAIQSINTKPQGAVMSTAMKEILTIQGSPHTIEFLDMDCLTNIFQFYCDVVFVAKVVQIDNMFARCLDYFEGVLSAIKSLNISMEYVNQLTAKVKKVFWTIRPKMMMPIVRSLGYIFCTGWRLIFEGLYIDTASIERIKKLVDEINEDVSLAFTPTHILCVLLPLPRIAAGNNFNLPLVGSYLRSNGSFFICRSFQGDTLYNETLTSYVHELLEDSTPIEVFVEGGRSRHGRVMKPSYEAAFWIFQYDCCLS
ncbi:glycerol-3-phosphate acyltransferase [Thraustotheca clavata]|uniref:Glycerol-3-phosphate acyltransferase n=1 Tax=Thraustotheca clavata TaxID=74557 RepID=A0A1V9YID6_9STRA|nr:glycerol-3-phosphate acyltransferase [Thraustotheca clavata]